MFNGKKILTLAFVAFMIAVGFTYEASAQRRSHVRRPVIVRSYIYRDPFWRTRYYSPYYYDSFYRSPYQRYLEQQYYLRNELAGNERELAEHLRKYRRDGAITAKERRELDDDIRDVQRSRQRLRSYSRNY